MKSPASPAKKAAAARHPHVSSTPPKPASNAQMVTDIVDLEDRLSKIAPEWKLVLKKKPGGGAQVVDYPRAGLSKGGKQVLLNDHAVRLVAAVGSNLPPQKLQVRVFYDPKHNLIGLSRADKDDDQAHTLSRSKNHAASWVVSVARAGIVNPPEQRVYGRLRTFGNRVYGFCFRPLELPPAAEPAAE